MFPVQAAVDPICHVKLGPLSHVLGAPTYLGAVRKVLLVWGIANRPIEPGGAKRGTVSHMRDVHGAIAIVIRIVGTCVLVGIHPGGGNDRVCRHARPTEGEEHTPTGGSDGGRSFTHCEGVGKNASCCRN